MSTFARKGLSAILLVVLFAGPVAAAAPAGERVESREAGLVAGWVGELVEWVAGWMRLRFDDGAPRQDASDERRGVHAISAANDDDGGGGYDPNN